MPPKRRRKSSVSRPILPQSQGISSTALANGPAASRLPLERECSVLTESLKAATVKTGEILRFSTSVKQYQLAHLVPQTPVTLTNGLSRELLRYDQACDAIEAQLAHALAVLTRDLERENSKVADAERAEQAITTAPAPADIPTDTPTQNPEASAVSSKKSPSPQTQASTSALLSADPSAPPPRPLQPKHKEDSDGVIHIDSSDGEDDDVPLALTRPQTQAAAQAFPSQTSAQPLQAQVQAQAQAQTQTQQMLRSHSTGSGSGTLTPLRRPSSISMSTIPSTDHLNPNPGGKAAGLTLDLSPAALRAVPIDGASPITLAPRTSTRGPDSAHPMGLGLMSGVPLSSHPSSGVDSNANDLFPQLLSALVEQEQQQQRQDNDSGVIDLTLEPDDNMEGGLDLFGDDIDADADDDDGDVEKLFGDTGNSSTPKSANNTTSTAQIPTPADFLSTLHNTTSDAGGLDVRVDMNMNMNDFTSLPPDFFTAGVSDSDNTTGMNMSMIGNGGGDGMPMDLDEMLKSIQEGNGNGSANA